MKSTKGKVITLLVVIGILIIGIGIAILLSNNKDMIEISNQVAKVEEFESNIDMSNVMSYYVDVSNYTVENEKKAEIIYEYTDTTGNDQYDTCQVRIIPVDGIDRDLVGQLTTGWTIDYVSPVSIYKTYKNEVNENVYIPNREEPMSIEIDTWRIGEDVYRYDWSDNISNSYIYGTVSYRYVDTIGNGKWNACIVTVAFQNGWHFSNDNWETDEEQNQYYKIFRSNTDNDQHYVYSQGSSGIITISVDKIGENITELSMENNATMMQGRSYQLKIEKESLGQEEKYLRWTSSNPNIAVVNQYGVVTAKGIGTAIIKVEALINKRGAAENLEEGFEGGTATCTVNVTRDNDDNIYATQSTTNGNMKYEYMDTSGDMKYDKCRVTVSNVFLEELPIGWERIEETSSNTIYKDYGSNATEIIDVDPRDGREDLIEIKVEQIGESITIYYESETFVDNNQNGCFVNYKYMDTTGNDQYDLCKVNITSKGDFYVNRCPEGWKVISSGEIEKCFAENENITLFKDDSSNGVSNIKVSVDKIDTYIIPVENITLDKTEESMEIGETTTLVATINPTNAINKKVTWSSSDNSIATVDETTGRVTAKSVGTATIIATTEDGNKTASCTVQVEPYYKSESEIQTQKGIIITYEYMDTTNDKRWDTCKVEITTPEAQIYIDTTEYDTWKKQDDWHYYKIFKEEVLNEEVLNEEIQVKHKGSDYERISIQVTEIGNYTIPVENITLNKDEESMEIGEKTTLEAIIEPTDAVNKEVRWLSSDSAVAKVNENGLIEALSVGNTVITAEAVGTNGEKVTATCNVEVLPILTGIKITTEPIKKQYNQGDKLNLEGLVVTAQYSDGSPVVLKEGEYKTNPENGAELTTTGRILVTVTYEGKTDTFYIDVVPRLIRYDITFPNKILYQVGEEIDLTGLRVNAVYSDDSTMEIPKEDYTIDIEGGNIEDILATVGEKIITVNYKDIYTATFNIQVVDKIVNPTVHKIEIIESPRKTEYKQGDKLDLTGLVVVGVYTTGEQVVITDYEISGATQGEELTEVGNKTITIKYGDLQPVSFVITVKEKESGNQGGSGNQGESGNPSGSENGNGSQSPTQTTTSSKVSNNGKETNANTAPKILPKTGIGETIRMYAIAFSIVMTIIGIIVIGSYVRYRKTPKE